MVLEVTLDIFSGRPNPMWSLEQDSAASLVLKLQALKHCADGTAPLSPGLGYRGFIIHSKDDSFRGPVKIYAGTVETPDGILEDRHRELEMWLLQTEVPHLDSNIVQMVTQEITSKRL